MPSELTDLESLNVTCHQDVVVGASFDDELGLIGRRARFISGLVVHCILQLSTIGCDLKQEEAARLTLQPLLGVFVNIYIYIF